MKPVYDEMHSRGPSAWFSDGANEREAILKMGEPWGGKKVLEIGCGEGDLLFKILTSGAKTIGIDYSDEAIRRGKIKYPHQNLHRGNYRDYSPIEEYFNERAGRLVLQGVLEHLDNPFEELKWMMDNLLGDKGDVITSSPMFVNPRGFVWMALNMVGAVMSKTDLHYLNPWDFEAFCKENGYRLEWTSTDHSWANGADMIADLKQRIPLALKDSNLPQSEEKLFNLLSWLEKAGPMIDLGPKLGATAIYKITKG